MRSQTALVLSALAAGLIGASTILTVPAMAEDAQAAPNSATVGTLTPAPAVFVGSNAPFATPFLAAAQPAEPAPVAAPVGPPPVGIETGPSPWTGEKLTSPRGGKFPKRVLRWANIVVAVMDEQKIPRKYCQGSSPRSNRNPMATRSSSTRMTATRLPAIRPRVCCRLSVTPIKPTRSRVSRI